MPQGIPKPRRRIKTVRPKGGIGRPSKFTPEVRERILQAVRIGAHFEVACEGSGVAYNTVRGWIVKGEAQPCGIFREFADAIREAESQAELSVVASWRRAIKGPCPEEAKHFLARRYPHRWSPVDRHEITGKDGSEVAIRGAVDLGEAMRELTEASTLMALAKDLGLVAVPKPAGGNGSTHLETPAAPAPAPQTPPPAPNVPPATPPANA